MTEPLPSRQVEGMGEEKVSDYEGVRERKSGGERKSSVVDAAVLQGEIFDERYETTQRGLKSRHAQMIALGGTIGTKIMHMLYADIC